MNEKLLKLKQQMAEISYQEAWKNYDELKEQWDVVLQPEKNLLVPDSYGVQQSGNWNHARWQVDEYAKTNKPKRKVLVVVLDTGSHSQNKFLNNRGQHLMEYSKDWTTDGGSGVDEHFHFSHVLSSFVGYHPDFPLGLCWSKHDEEQWAWSAGQKVLNRSGSGSYNWIKSGAEYCLDIKKKLGDEWIIWMNFSLGGSSSSPDVDAVLKELRQNGVFISASSGNSGKDPNGGSRVGFPGRSENVLGIASCDTNLRISPFSSQGPEVDYCSGGSSVIGCGAGVDDLRLASGTSMSSPNFGATAARIVACEPDIKNMDDLEEYLDKHITDAGDPGRDEAFGKGLVFMGDYKTDPTPPPPPPPPPPAPEEPMFKFDTQMDLNLVFRDSTIGNTGNIAERANGYTMTVEVRAIPNLNTQLAFSILQQKVRVGVHQYLNQFNHIWVTGEDDSEMYLAARTLKRPVKKLDGMKAVTLFNLAVYFKAGVWEHLGELVTEIDHVKISLADPQLGDAIA